MPENTTVPGYVCMAVYKPNVDLLRVQIDSLRCQTHADWKCIVGLDGINREVAEQLDELTRDDTRFSVVSFADRVGFYRNFERILQLLPAQTPWVALADQDDYWEPEKLELLVPYLQDHSLVTGQARIHRHGASELTSQAEAVTDRRSVGLAAMMIDNQITGSLALFRGQLLKAALPFPAPTDLAFHDHWLAICASVEMGIKVLPDVVQDYVQHNSNVIGEEGNTGMLGRLRRLRHASEGSVGSQLDYLSAHRWGWRVNMARTVISRHRNLNSSQMRALNLYSHNRFSLGLISAYAIECMRGRAPIARSLALLIGSLRA